MSDILFILSYVLSIFGGMLCSSFIVILFFKKYPEILSKSQQDILELIKKVKELESKPFVTKNELINIINRIDKIDSVIYQHSSLLSVVKKKVYKLEDDSKIQTISNTKDSTDMFSIDQSMFNF